MDEWMDGRTDGWMDGRMDGWMDEWMDGWMDGWMDERMLFQHCCHLPWPHIATYEMFLDDKNGQQGDVMGSEK